ncbi:hypothetical protein ABZY58_11920 [Micromonospora tulbaghiae]|uniref:hypothetical protein n=1 Tax=Micromonospora tulbaghiae TaxID=479978 RepID=UPI0033B28175
MTDSPSYSALREHNRVTAALIADPEVTGDLLLVGMWLARATILRDPPPGEGRWSFTSIAGALFGHGRPLTITGMGATTRVPNYLVARVKQAVRADRPHYDPDRDNAADPWMHLPCRAPMIRREGECGQHGTMYDYLTDLTTGRQVRIAACRRHKPWYDHQVVTNREAVRDAGDRLPRPAANAGGALARHIGGVNWPRIWQMVDPHWTPPPEGASTRKPTLRVLRNDDFEPSEDRPAPRLVVHEGGWR